MLPLKPLVVIVGFPGLRGCLQGDKTSCSSSEGGLGLLPCAGWHHKPRHGCLHSFAWNAYTRLLQKST